MGEQSTKKYSSKRESYEKKRKKYFSKGKSFGKKKNNNALAEKDTFIPAWSKNNIQAREMLIKKIHAALKFPTPSF